MINNYFCLLCGDNIKHFDYCRSCYHQIKDVRCVSDFTFNRWTGNRLTSKQSSNALERHINKMAILKEQKQLQDEYYRKCLFEL